ncbi:unnamed protein product [Notodromas monacha]|uniref:Uncharacterized protein n=1 Tax=Notodromas monacha TaxID=399045 RepID=A0A7R9BQT2_9CRUS|nr:unnamed protein product [Notodromas monacha]CAG0919996.1 unnamed protein product [Notodromas monacha]
MLRQVSSSFECPKIESSTPSHTTDQDSSRDEGHFREDDGVELSDDHSDDFSDDGDDIHAETRFPSSVHEQRRRSSAPMIGIGGIHRGVDHDDDDDDAIDVDDDDDDEVDVVPDMYVDVESCEYNAYSGDDDEVRLFVRRSQPTLEAPTPTLFSRLRRVFPMFGYSRRRRR